MKCSELIGMLQNMVDEIGDVEVFSNIEGDYGDLTSVEVEEGEDGEIYLTMKSDAIVDEDLDNLEE